MDELGDEIGGDPGATFPANGLVGLFDLIDRNVSRIGHRIPLVHELQQRGLLCASSLLLGLLGLLLLLLLPPSVGWALRRTGRLDTNFRGERIPQSFGLVTLLWAAAMLGATAFLYAEQRERSLVWLAGCAGYGLLGLLDDTCGTREIKGLGGHIRAALRDHRITTGLIKALGGMALALWLAVRLTHAPTVAMVLDACVIALSANAVNLLDLRPGRAGAVFLACAIPAVLLELSGLATSGFATGGFAKTGVEAGVPPLLLVAIPTARIWVPDAEGRVMMGDTGSNLLGGALGMAIVTMGGLALHSAALCVLIGLHILAERRSLTAIIQANRFLNALDRMTGVR